jgi:hypothetical protein
VNINDFSFCEAAGFQLLTFGAVIAITGVCEGRHGDRNLGEADAENHEGSERRDSH